MTTVFVLNGPNLNLLGVREPGVYGSARYADLEALCARVGQDLGLDVAVRQSNHEGQLIDWVHEAATAAAGIVLNAGAYTHTSIALHDAVRAVALPVIEVHVSNVFAREDFRHRSLIAPVARGVICGFGLAGYEWALRALARDVPEISVTRV